MDDHTLTIASTPAPAAEPTLPSLCIAWHPDPRWLGLRRSLKPGEELLIGRGAESLGPGVLDLGDLSRRHAVLRVSARGVEIEDLGSRNGTELDGVPAQKATLREGAVLALGSLLLVFRGPHRPTAPALVPELVGASQAMDAVRAEILLAAPRPGPVLLLGETGTGKEVAARALHRLSGRSGLFIAVNCGEMPEALQADALFGHRGGAFTGAARARSGLARAAEGGTLFLDEIGEAPPTLQTALLRLVELKEVRPVGADLSEPVDIRILAATNSDLDAAVARGEFRSDLLYRLQRFPVRLPPLRARAEDIPLLALHLARRHLSPKLSPTLERDLALRWLRAPWPGNVRELDAAVERLAMVAREGVLRDENPERDEVPQPSLPSPPQRPTPEALAQMLAEVGGNVSALATRLGVARRTLYRWGVRGD